MANVDDVAAAILARCRNSLDTFKLQKLTYYCQAWHLVYEDRPLFDAKIEAWANGPVVPKLYRQHRRQYRVTSWPTGDPGRLDPDEQSTVDMVVDFYGHMSGAELAALTHRENPWREARQEAGLIPGARGNVEITKAAMLEYYSSLIA